MIRWMMENVGLMLLALVFAVGVWIAAEWEHDPILTREFDQSVSVQVKNIPPQTYLVDGWRQDVRIRLQAPSSVWEQITLDDFDAVINLTRQDMPLEPGVYEVPVDVSVDLESVVILSVEPRFIQVELEAIRERVISVAVTVEGDPELGYQADDPLVLTDTVRVSGPSSKVNQVRQAVSSVVLEGKEQETLEKKTVSLIPVDAEGKRVIGVTLEPEQVDVRVPIRKLFNYKEMAVKVDILGEPASDYYVSDVRINPSVVRVIGSAFVLDDLSGVLSTVPISIEGRAEDVVERLPLKLDPGVATVYPSEPAVQVTVDIEPFQGSVKFTRTLTFQGLSPDLMAEASPSVVEVILSGPRPRLSSLLPENVPVILDVSSLGRGDVAQLEPVVIRPEGIHVDSVIPAIIQVEIKRKPQQTPTSQTQETPTP